MWVYSLKHDFRFYGFLQSVRIAISILNDKRSKKKHIILYFFLLFYCFFLAYIIFIAELCTRDKKQNKIKPQVPEGHKQNEILPSFNNQQVSEQS